MDQKMIDKIESEIRQIQYPQEPKELYEPIRYILSLGGKRIRPLVSMMAAELFGMPKDNRSVLHLAKSLEIFHNFSLVHDDIMDEAPLRRGMPTVHEKWTRDVAILSGDVMLVRAYQELIETKSDRLVDLLKQFNESAILVCEGQQLDMNFEQEEEVSLDRYLKMIELKTAELLACSLKMGAILAGASEKDAKALYQFGINLGLAFQIQDDYLDSFADSAKFGKQIGGDILANKKTYLMVTCRQQADPDQRDRMDQLLKLKGDEKVEKVLNLYKEVGVDQACQQAIEHYYQKALHDLGQVQGEEQAKEPLASLAAMIMKRDH